MKNFFAALLLFVGTFAFAQNSAVTGTVTDSDGQTWNNGTYQISFVPPSGYTGSAYTFNGSPWTPPTPINGFMNGAGIFSYSPLPRNDYILPSGSGWAFTVCPIASAQCSTTTFVINQATQNLSSSLVVVGPRFAASNIVNGSYGYNDQEILPTNPPIGNFYWNVTIGAQKYWNGSAWISFINYILPSTVVQTNQANTYGPYVQDFSSATGLKVPSSLNGCLSASSGNLSGSGLACGTSGIPYPGAGIPNSTGSAWASSYGVLGSGANVVLPSGTAAAGSYVDGGSYVWTQIPGGPTVIPSGDTTGATDGAAIQTSCANAGYARLLAGTYYVGHSNSTISITAPCTINGASKALTIIQNEGTTNWIITTNFSESDPSSNYLPGLTVTNLSIHQDSNITPTAGGGIKVAASGEAFNSSVFEHLYLGGDGLFSGFYIGPQMGGMTMDDVYMWIAPSGPTTGQNCMEYNDPPPSGDSNLSFWCAVGAGTTNYAYGGLTIDTSDTTSFPNLKIWNAPVLFQTLSTGAASIRFPNLSLEGGFTGLGCGIDFGTGAYAANDITFVGEIAGFGSSPLCNLSNVSGFAYNLDQRDDNLSTEGWITLTTNGDSGAATLNQGVLNIPNYAGGSGGSTIPSNAAFIYAGISVNDDDEQVLSPSVSITGWTTTGGVTTVTNSGTNNFVTNQWVSMRFATGWSFCPSGEALGTGCSLFQVLSSGLSSTQFEISTSAISAGSCASSCGVAHSAMSYLPFATSSAGTFPSAALSNTVVFIPNPVNISGLASNYATFIHPLRPSVTGKPTYLIINNPNNDAASCTAASTIEGYYNTIFADAHTDGITVVVGTPTGTYWNQFGLGCSTAYTIQATVDSWLRAEGKAAVLANSSTSTQYWDIVSDLGSILYDGSNTNNIVAANSGLAPAGADIAARRLSMDIFNATGTLLPKSIWYGVQNGSGFANVTGNVYAPFADGPMYQWLNASRTAVEMALNTGLGYLQVASKLSIDGCSNGGSWQLCLNGSVTGTFYVDADANVGTSGNVSAGGYVNAGSYDISGSAAATTINSTNCNLGGSCTIPVGVVQLGQAIASGGSQTTLSFPSISGAYSNLELKCNGRSSASSPTDFIKLVFNSDVNNDYQDIFTDATGSTSSTTTSSARGFFFGGNLSAATSPSGSSGSTDTIINNYTSTTFLKQIVTNSGNAFATFGGSSSQERVTLSSQWNATPQAITRIDVSLGSGLPFVNTSVCTLDGWL